MMPQENANKKIKQKHKKVEQNKLIFSLNEEEKIADLISHNKATGNIFIPYNTSLYFIQKF